MAHADIKLDKKEHDKRSFWRRIRYTPLRHLLRGDVSSALDWQAETESNDLPEPIRVLIDRLVKRTRLWRIEKVAVARELTAHFRDGLSADVSAEQLIDDFGDEQVAAKLISRGKRRARPLGWRIRHRARQGFAVFAGFYLLFALWLYSGKPEPSIDYLAKINEPFLNVSEEDKAWPIIREAMIEHRVREKLEHDYFAENFERKPSPENDAVVQDRIRYGDSDIEKLVAGIAPFGVFLEQVRLAASKPNRGYEVQYFDALSERDKMVLTWDQPDDTTTHFVDEDSKPTPSFRTHALMGNYRPHVGINRLLTRLLTVELQTDVHLRKPQRFVDNICAIAGLAEHARQGPFTIDDLIGVSIAATALREISLVLHDQPGLFNASQLAEMLALADKIAQTSWLDFEGERYSMEDTLQRIYDPVTGRLTLEGMRFLRSLVSEDAGWEVPGAYWGEPFRELIAGLSMPWTAGLVGTYKDNLDKSTYLFEQNKQRPSGLIHCDAPDPFNDFFLEYAHDPRLEQRYFPIGLLMSATSAAYRTEGTLIAQARAVRLALALELYKQENGGYPIRLQALVPNYLDALPMDPTALNDLGESIAPLRVVYRDGKPVIYAVGWDSVDNGGEHPSSVKPADRTSNRLPATQNGGDWVLHPMNLGRWH